MKVYGFFQIELLIEFFQLLRHSARLTQRSGVNEVIIVFQTDGVRPDRTRAWCNSSCHILLFVSCLGSILEHLFLCTLVKSGGSIYT